MELRVNRLPEVQSLELSPDPIYTTDDLVATAVLSDPHMDSLNVIYDWYENGQLTPVIGDTVSAVDVQSGDEWRLWSRQMMGMQMGCPKKLPSLFPIRFPLSNLTASPTGTVYNDQVVNRSSVATDPDQSIFPIYEWFVDGTQYISSALDLSTTVAIPGSTVTCLATVTDDEGVSIQDSIDIVIGNRTPTVSNVTVDVSGPTTNDLVNCSALLVIQMVKVSLRIMFGR